jgi:hypothetical protein
MIKKSPFEVSNQGKSIDEKYFVRLRKIENHYLIHSQKDKSFAPNFNATSKINRALQKEKLSIDDIEGAIEVFNSTNEKNHHEGSGWLDLRLHLRHLAFIYGMEYTTDEASNLVKKETCD